MAASASPGPSPVRTLELAGRGRRRIGPIAGLSREATRVVAGTAYAESMELQRSLKALADATRLRIVAFLLDPVQTCRGPDDGVCSCDLEEFLGLTQPTVHHHMRVLTEAGFVTAERRGRWIYCALNPASFRALAGHLDDVARAAVSAPGRTLSSRTDPSDADAAAASPQGGRSERAVAADR